MSLLEDALAIDGARPPGCTVCRFIEEQPEERHGDFDELLNTPGKKGTASGDGYAVGHAAVAKILAREGFDGKSTEPIRNHRAAGHRR